MSSVSASHYSVLTGFSKSNTSSSAIYARCSVFLATRKLRTNSGSGVRSRYAYGNSLGELFGA